MNAIIYLLQVSACLALFYSFYYLMLNRLTFFTINRYYLLFTLVIGFAIPLLTIPIHTQYHSPVVQQVVNMRSENVPFVANTATGIAEPRIYGTWTQLLQWGYMVAVVGLLIHLLITLTNFFVKLKHRKISSLGNIHILRSDKNLPNGSFLNYIFLNDNELSVEEMEQIVAHEMLHVKLLHSADRVLMKLVQIILWFNPIVYLYARSMEENHEFEVDREIAYSTDKTQYADLLLHLSVASQGMLYHSFSKVPLKKRIVMLFNKPSAKVKRVVYVLVLPILVISCLAFARLKTDDPKPVSAILEIKNLGKNPLVLIDKKVYPASILYKISGSVIQNTYTASGKWAIKKYGQKAKDGVIVITTKKGEIKYMTPIEKENLTKIDNAASDFYTRVTLKKEDGTSYEMVKITLASGSWASADMPENGKVGFIINNNLYDEKTFKSMLPALEKVLSHTHSIGAAEKQGFASLAQEGYKQDLSAYDAILSFPDPIPTGVLGNNITKPNGEFVKAPDKVVYDMNSNKDVKPKTDTPKYNVRYDFKKMADTAEYRVAAFKLNVNSPLLELINTLPNLAVSGEDVFYGNKKITALLINDIPYNGGNIMQGLKSLPANSFSSVLVYSGTDNSANPPKINVISKPQ